MEKKELLKPVCAECPVAKEIAKKIVDLLNEDEDILKSAETLEHQKVLLFLDKAVQQTNIIIADNTITGNQSKTTASVKVTSPIIELYEKGHKSGHVTFEECVDALELTLGNAKSTSEIIMNQEAELEELLRQAREINEKNENSRIVTEIESQIAQNEYYEHQSILDAHQQNCPGTEKKLLRGVVCQSPELSHIEP